MPCKALTLAYTTPRYEFQSRHACHSESTKTFRAPHPSSFMQAMAVSGNVTAEGLKGILRAAPHVVDVVDKHLRFRIEARLIDAGSLQQVCILHALQETILFCN